MVCGLIEYQQIGRIKQKLGQNESGALAAREHADRLFHIVPVKAKGAGEVS